MVVGLWVLPVTSFVVMAGNLAGTYIAASLLSHIDGGFPYISDMATTLPESAVFAQLMHISSTLVGCVMYIKYLQVKKILSTHPNMTPKESLAKQNVISFCFGVGICLGLSMVSNFHNDSMFNVHVIGGFVLFGSGVVYFPIQVLLSYRLRPYTGSTVLAHFRFVLAVVIIVGSVCLGILRNIANAQYEGIDSRKWCPNDGGYVFHAIGAVGQWACVASYCFFILTFSIDFKRLKLNHKVFLLDETIPMNSDLKKVQPQNEMESVKIHKLRLW